jgi:signal transduction histidine kinase
MQQALATGHVAPLANGTTLLRSDGSAIAIDDSVAPIKDERGRVLGGVMVFRDVSEKRRAEKENELALARQRQAAEELEAASRSKDEFLSIVSHELRTPLNVVMGWAHVLKQCQLDREQVARAVAAIERNTAAQVALVNDLLDVRQMIAGRVTLAVEAADLVQVVLDSSEALRPAADAKRISLEVRASGAAEPVLIDPARIRQIVWNLVSNAVKFCDEGARIDVACEMGASTARITVADTGPGISAELLPHIFERFMQGDQSSTRAHGGLGLGLAIVRHLTALHGGTVSAASPGVGAGATFTVLLPLQRQAPTVAM